MTTHDDTSESWELAHSIQLTPCADVRTFGCSGVITAERHAAGWFISAHHDPAISRDGREQFADFVITRTQLLLEYGPQSALWDCGRDDVWRTFYVADELDLSPTPVDALLTARLRRSEFSGDAAGGIAGR